MDNEYENKKKLNNNSLIYIHKNDPKFINQGVNTATIKHVEGGYMPFISDIDYAKRKLDNLSYNYNINSHGSRPMHQTTYVNNNNSYIKNDFITSNKKDYQGFQLNNLHSKESINSQFNHNFNFGYDNKMSLNTQYSKQFFFKSNNENLSSNEKKTNTKLQDLKQQNIDNLLKNRKSNVDEILSVNENDINYWSQYKRTHHYLGVLRAPVVSHEYSENPEYPERKAYHVLTGKPIKSSWSPNSSHKRVSGNKILHSLRKESQNILN